MYNRVVKRMLDLLLSIIGLVLFIPVLLVVASMIWLDDHGPVFYNAYRIGRNGKLFKMLKFRSMKVNAPDIRLNDGSTYNGEDDPRVTRIGKFLRKTSVDELPQVVNVFLGEMSFIGPRPDPPDWMERYPEEIKVFLTARPGITGYTQAYFRNGIDSTEKMKQDAYYAEHCSFWFDVKIFFKTVAMVFSHSNVYRDTTGEDEALREVQALRQ